MAFCWQIPAQKRRARDSRMGRSVPPCTAATSLYSYSALNWQRQHPSRPWWWLHVCICCSFSLIPNVQSLSFTRQIEGQASLSWGQLETAGTGYNASSNIADELNYHQNALPRATISQICFPNKSFVWLEEEYNKIIFIKIFRDKGNNNNENIGPEWGQAPFTMKVSEDLRIHFWIQQTLSMCFLASHILPKEPARETIN